MAAAAAMEAAQAAAEVPVAAAAGGALEVAAEVEVAQAEEAVPGAAVVPAEVAEVVGLVLPSVPPQRPAPSGMAG